MEVDANNVVGDLQETGLSAKERDVVVNMGTQCFGVAERLVYGVMGLSR